MTARPLLLAAVAVAALTTLACATAAPGLAGSAWRLAAIGDAAALDRAEATLDFPAPGKVSGLGSCNRFTGAAEISGASLRLGPLAGTRLACADEALSRQEERYLDALQRAERFAIDGATLRIWSRGANAPLRFVRID